MTLSIEASTAPAGHITITLIGELDQTTAAAVRTAFVEALAAGSHQVCLDLAQVTFMDSSGLGVMVAAHKACALAGCQLTVAGVSRNLYQRLHVSGLTDMFGLAEPPPA